MKKINKKNDKLFLEFCKKKLEYYIIDCAEQACVDIYIDSSENLKEKYNLNDSAIDNIRKDYFIIKEQMEKEKTLISEQNDSFLRQDFEPKEVQLEKYKKWLIDNPIYFKDKWIIDKIKYSIVNKNFVSQDNKWSFIIEIILKLIKKATKHLKKKY